MRTAASLLFAGAFLACAQESRIILLEDFESFASTEALLAVWPGGSGVLGTNVPGGGRAALHDGGNLHNRNVASVSPDATHNVVFTADLYDSGTNEVKRTTVALRNSSGSNFEFGMINEGCCYYARAVGFEVPPDWVPFDQAQKPVPGWHRFQAVMSATNTLVTLDLGADGTIDKTLSFSGPAPLRPFTAIRFGGLPGRISRGGPVFVDNIKLELVPLDSIGSSASTGGVRVVKPPPERPAPLPTSTVAPRPTAVALTPASVAAAGNGRAWGSVGWAIAGALAIVIGLLAWVVLLLRRTTLGPPRALLPLASASGAAMPDGSSAAIPRPGSHEEWKQRALVAEELAQKQAQVLKEKLVPELAEFAKHGLVQGLYTQRNELVETQRRAQQELAELETRLAGLQLPLQERIRVYEQRINELEKELETRGEEMRELIRTTLLLVRQRLEEEKEKGRAQPGLN